MKKCPTCGEEYGDANTLCPSDGAVLQKDKDELVGQTLAGKYRVEARIDEGGMGAVYRATHVLMEKTVAIKVLHPALAADEKIVARFTREAKAASRISHPHALNVTDFGEDTNGIVYLVMEFIRGRTLKEIIRREGRMPLARVVEIIRQVCGALTAAHAEGVVHRDLKSDNIMLEEAGDGGDWAKVLDFGIAKIIEVGNKDPGLTAPNLIIGTPQYMSPEQCAQASEIDSRSDIYSLGIILFEMLVGHVPFAGDSPTAIMMKHLQSPAPSVLEERPDLPPTVGRVVARSLSKRPEDRHQTAGELAEDLALAAEGKESIEAAAIGAVSDAERELRDTNRIVVPTAPNEAPRTTASQEMDEATVVQTAAPPPPTEQEIPSILNTTPVPPPSTGFRPLHFIVPAVAVLVVVFGLVYFFQRGTNNATGQDQNAPLTVDPNGVPVQAAPPVSGESERNITPGTLTPGASPQDITGGGQTTNTTGTNPGGTANPNQTPAQGETTERNQNSSDDNNADQSDDNTTAEATPTPERTPRRRATTPVLVNPTPAPDDDDDAPPPPKKETPASTPPDISTEDNNPGR